MNYRKIINDAWHLADNHRNLQWFAVFPMVAALIVAMVYVPFRYGNYFFDDFTSTAFQFVRRFYESYTSIFIIGAVVFGIACLIYLLFRAFFEGGLIGMINQIVINNGQKISNKRGFAYAMKTYGKLIKLHAVTSFMNPFYVLFALSLIRERLPSLFDSILIPGIILFLINIFLELGIVFSDYSLVMYNKPVIKSIKHSFTIVVFNLRETLFVFVILGLIIARSIINLIVAFLVPSLLIWLGFKVIDLLPSVFVITMITIIGLVLYYYLIRYATYIMVFTHSVWVYTLRTLVDKSQHEIAIMEAQDQ